MSSREKILSAVKNNQPDFSALPTLENFVQAFSNVVEKYKTVLQSIGGNVYEVNNFDECIGIIQSNNLRMQKELLHVDNAFCSICRIISIRQGCASFERCGYVAIIPTHFAVAENGSVWIRTEDLIKERVLPFICQHLIAIVDKKNIIATMHDAYELIGDREYGFSSFIAGPSKTDRYRTVIGTRGAWTKNDDCIYSRRMNT